MTSVKKTSKLCFSYNSLEVYITFSQLAVNSLLQPHTKWLIFLWNPRWRNGCLTREFGVQGKTMENT